MAQETQVDNLVINKLTEEQYQQLLASGQVSDTEIYLTPDEGGSGGAKVTFRKWGT